MEHQTGMMWRKRLIRMLVGLIVMYSAQAALAAPPNLNISVITSTQSPKSDDLARISEYVAYWTTQLGNGQASAPEAAQAAQQLIDPAMTNNAGASFLSAYSSKIVPALRDVLKKNKDEYRAVLAAKVLGFLSTPDALEELCQWLDSDMEKRSAVRLWAARGSQLLIRRLAADAAAGGMNERQINTALRRLQDAASREDDWLVMYRQFQAMAAANTETGRQRQVDAFKAVATRLKRSDGEQSKLMDALSRVMFSFRNQFLLLNQQQQRSFGAQLAPLLGEVFDIALVDWDTAQANPEAKLIYGQAVQQCENLLRFIHTTIQGQQPPSSALFTAWNANNRAKFESDTKSWRNVLTQPPYGK